MAALTIIDDELWQRVQKRVHENDGKPKDARLQSGGRAIYLLSGVLRCAECGAHFVMDGSTHYRCGSARDGKACNNSLRVRRDLAERLILTPIRDRLLNPEIVAEMAKEMHRHYSERAAEAQRTAASTSSVVADLDSRLARLRERAKAGDPDMTADELLAIIEKAETKRAGLLAALPAAKASAKVLTMLPRAAELYRRQIAQGLQGNPREAAQARAVVRQLVGGKIELAPDKARAHLIARFGLHRLPLLRAAGGVGSVGSGGRLRNQLPADSSDEKAVAIHAIYIREPRLTHRPL